LNSTIGFGGTVSGRRNPSLTCDILWQVKECRYKFSEPDVKLI